MVPKLFGIVKTLETAENHRMFTSSGPGICPLIFQWLFLVPLKGGRWHIIPQLAVYTTYILPFGGLYATYHLLGEPETTIGYW